MSIANTRRGEADHGGGIVRQLFTQKPNPSSWIDCWREFPARSELRPSSRPPRASPHAASLGQSPAPSALHLSCTNGSKRRWKCSSTWQASWANSGSASVYKSTQKRWPRDPQAICSARFHAQYANHTTEFPRPYTQSTSRFYQQTRSIHTSKRKIKLTCISLIDSAVIYVHWLWLLFFGSLADCLIALYPVWWRLKKLERLHSHRPRISSSPFQWVYTWNTLEQCI